MYEVIIRQPDGGDASGKLVPGSYTVGTRESCHIQLDRPEISGNHAQLIVRNDSLQVVDLDSSNGTYVEGVKIPPQKPYEVPIGGTIAIGNVLIFAKGPESSDDFKGVSPEAPPHHHDPEMDKKIKKAQKEADKQLKTTTNEIPVLRISGIPEKVRPLVQEIKRRAHLELLKRLNLKKMAISGTSQEELENRAKETITEILSELSIPLPKGAPIEVIEKELIQEAIGLGPLEYLIEMDDITEIMVNGPNNVYVENKGVIYKTDTAFADDKQVLSAIERIVSPLGRRIDESSPMVDARLKDGSRVNAIIPPLSLVGPSITIRKFAKNPYTIDDLINFGSLTPEISEFLEACVQVRKNIIISGGTGSGKTTLLNVLSAFLPNRERIVTIEDAAELQLNQDHVVRLESRPPNIEGKGAITIRDLVRNSLRMRPDRIVVGECRGGEALDMLQAMNTGHDGSLTTVHANTPRDALARLETLVLMAGFDLPLRAIREQICSAIKIIVQVNREKDGSRKITHVSEITKMEGDIITMQDIFVFKHEGWDENEKITGSYVPTGSVPTFMEEIKRAKIPLDISIFSRGI
jgi:pilus assembly protein CpaF